MVLNNFPPGLAQSWPLSPGSDGSTSYSSAMRNARAIRRFQQYFIMILVIRNRDGSRISKKHHFPFKKHNTCGKSVADIDEAPNSRINRFWPIRELLR
ncbi:hypothetical protein PoB_003420800 [Plakobranchus ocellatus]|uniref:Uncharacterized protein n=1 Tax=Plakobranchus ocellatus TaxID=259542 RepID=A0AAV4AK70_9GAST|nr:hypothetical protein PoB_003420800 [Plakobranchus ocellatus]